MTYATCLLPSSMGDMQRDGRFGDDGKLWHVMVLFGAMIVVYSAFGWIIFDGYIRR